MAWMPSEAMWSWTGKRVSCSASRARRASAALSSTRRTSALDRFMGTPGLHGEREGEGGPLSLLRLDPDAASMTLYDLLANGKTKSCPLVLVPGVEALENDEEALVKFWVEA